MTRRTSLAITLIVGGAGHHAANAFVPSPSLLSTNGATRTTRTTGGRIAGTTGAIAIATSTGATRRHEDIGTDSTRNRRRQQSSGPLHMFVGFQDDRAPRNREPGLPGDDPYGRGGGGGAGGGYGREDFRGIHSHDIPWRDHMPNAANDDGMEPYPVLWQYAQNGNWNEVYTRILDYPEEATYEINGWTPLHLLVAGNGIPAPLAVVRAVYAAHPEALHKRTHHYGRTPLDIAVRWNQPQEVLEFLADPTILELEAGDDDEELMMLQQQQLLQLSGSGRPELAASGNVIDAAVDDGPYALQGTDDENDNVVFEFQDPQNEVVEPPHEQPQQQQQQQQQRAVGYEKPPPINTGNGLDNGWASAAVSVNGNSQRSFADDTTATVTGHIDYEANFGDNVYQQQRPVETYQPGTATAPKNNRVQVVSPSYTERPSEAVSNNYYAPPPPPEPEYVEPANVNVLHDNYFSAAADEEEAEYFAAIQKQYYGGGDMEEPTAEVEVTTTEYVQPVDANAGLNDDQDSNGMKPIEPEIVGNGAIEVISSSNEDQDDEDEEETVRLVEADVILDDTQFEEEIYNKKIMEEVRVQQYEDEMAVREAQDRMKQRASSRGTWNNWGAKNGHSWMNR
mmetsp:Transcript_6295/g.17590  ORF Transcript_6295/g.17590 Transcript_6295/m.17590 type:complete len:622 (-) Transcript_6295:88-1953(-)